MPSPRNLAELLLQQAQRYGPRPFARFRRAGLYHDCSWESFVEQVESAALALIDRGVQHGDRVAVLSENRFEWLVADQAILAAGAVSVPMHAPLGAPQVRQQLVDSGAVFAFASNAEQSRKLVPALHSVVQMAEPAERGWAGFLQRGRLSRSRYHAELASRQEALNESSLATLMYTSGTTGAPKGVMLTHGNLLANMAMMHEACEPIPADAVLFNWLPLSHVYARTVDFYLALFSGVTLALAEASETVVRDLSEVQPTHMTAVPRFYEKLLASVATLPAEVRGARLRGIFGPRMDWLGSGGAPLPVAIARAFHDAGLEIHQGYGLTETSPVITTNRRGRNRLGSVGEALPHAEVRIAEDGEILTRGPHVMSGYWNQPDASAMVLKEGWFHTGDLGRLDADGYLAITGRKKELLILSNGKKVAPTYVEGLLAAEPCVEQVVVVGEGKPFLTALVVPCWPRVREAVGCLDAPLDELLSRGEVRHLLQDRFDRLLASVANWEKVRKIVVVRQPFSVARDELTVSLKLRREVIMDHFREEIEMLYCG